MNMEEFGGGIIPGLIQETSFMDTLMKYFNAAMVGFRTVSSFPSAPDGIMGLPPLYHHTENDLNIENQIKTNFPILHMQPLNLKAGEKEGSQDVVAQAIAVTFKYAVQVDNSINISHTNTYAQSQITDRLKQMLDSNAMRDLSQLSKVYTGTGMDNILSGVVAGTSEALKDMGMDKALESLIKGNNIDGKYKDILQDVGRGVLEMSVGGARVDFPNVWQDSQTGMSHSFTIELRTFATKPSDPEYIKDIITPLEILLHLALPMAENSMAYVEPPYVKAHIPNVFEIRLGGITNMSWSIPLSTLNLRGIPRHIQVNLTITDLYNVMVNDKNNKSIEHAPTLQKFINHLKKNPDHLVANQNIWKNEFDRGVPNYDAYDDYDVNADSGSDEKKPPITVKEDKIKKPENVPEDVFDEFKDNINPDDGNLSEEELKKIFDNFYSNTITLHEIIQKYNPNAKKVEVMLQYPWFFIYELDPKTNNRIGRIGPMMSIRSTYGITFTKVRPDDTREHAIIDLSSENPLILMYPK